MKTKLKEILQYYNDNYSMDGATMDEVYNELIANDVEVRGNSFFCIVHNEELAAKCLLAGTMDKADLWVLKKIIKVLRTGERVYSMLNGNSDYILPQLEKFNSRIIKRDKDVTYIQFN